MVRLAGHIAPRALPIALTVAVLCVIPEIVGRFTHSLVPGTVLLGGLGWLYGGFRLGTRERAHPWPGPISPIAWGLLFLFASVLAMTSLWDRTGHATFVGALARGVIPLQNPLFPGEPLVYHVGFDVAVATLVEFTRFPLGVGIEVGQWFTVGLAVLALREMFPEHRFFWILPIVIQGPLAVCTGAVPLVELCPGFPLFLDPHSAPPPPPSNLLQPPQGLGIAVAFAYLAAQRRGAIGRGVTFLLFWGLSQINLVVFLLLGLSSLLAALVGLWRARNSQLPEQQRSNEGGLRDSIIIVVELASAFALWLLLGTFRATASTHLVPGGFFGSSTVWGILIFYPHLVVAVAAIMVRLLKPEAPPRYHGLVAATVAGLSVFLLVRYQNSWDIVKFGTVAAFFGGILVVEQIERLPRFVVIAGVVACLTAPTAWLLRYSWVNIPHNDSPGEEELGEEFVRRFGGLIPPFECVTTPATKISNGGILTVGSDLEIGATMVLDREMHGRSSRTFKRLMATGALEPAVQLGCPFIFVPDSWTPMPALAQALEPVGSMWVVREQWTLYQFRDAEEASAGKGGWSE
jgi:hypothetical protein